MSTNESTVIQSDQLNRETIEISEPILFIVQLDSMEIERLKIEQGEDVFYTAADDLMWYNSMVLEKMDSLNIPVTYIKKNTIDIKTPDSTHKIVKDNTFSIYTYFHYDRNEFSRKDVSELLNK